MIDFFSLFTTRRAEVSFNKKMPLVRSCRVPKRQHENELLFEKFETYAFHPRGFLYHIYLPQKLMVPESILNLQLESKWTIKRSQESRGSYSRGRRSIQERWFNHSIYCDEDGDYIMLQLMGLVDKYGTIHKDPRRQKAKYNAQWRANQLRVAERS